MSLIAADQIVDICSRGIIRDSDVLNLRQIIYGKASIAAADIEALFSIDDQVGIQDPAWAAFFIEAATDFLINELPPQGYVTAGNADWLIERVGRDGRVSSATGLELVVNVLDQARWVPAPLVRFALDQIKRAVIDGDGPLRAGNELKPGQLSADDVALLRRVLNAFGSAGTTAITRPEAEVLFDIEDATAAGLQPPEWQELFIKAIAGAVLAASGYKVTSRTEALRQGNSLAGRGELSIDDCLGVILASHDQMSAEERALVRLERQRIEIITNAEVSECEAAWIARRLGKDGGTTPSQRLLLAFLKRESSHLHPALQHVADKVANAA